jgi:uncharacterized protein YcaQ
MILLSRVSGYQPKHLGRLLEKERTLFENWTHDASLIPTAFYPYWMGRFEAKRHSLAERYRRWHGPVFLKETNQVLRHIEENGPVLSRDLSAREKKGPGAWWNWHPSKTALEYLWRIGELAISRREGFQKVYDLTHRVIPGQYRSVSLDRADLIAWSCRSALERLGAGTAGEIAGFWDNITAGEAKAWCEARIGKECLQARIGQMDGKPRLLYARTDLESILNDCGEAPSSVRLLNPFDPVLRDRKRLMGLFGFDYRIEVFVPQPKRQYGYYVFPILEGERLIGRIDMKADRQADCLRVTGIWAEKGRRLSKSLMKKLSVELDRHRKFAGVHHLKFELHERSHMPESLTHIE